MTEGIEINATEQYVAITIDIELEPQIDWGQIKNESEELLMDLPYLIIDGIHRVEVSQESARFFGAWAEELKNQNGILVLVHTNEEQGDKHGYTVIPSFDEAVDYVYMEQLTRDLENE